tara:strand:- start:361 stop:843 length:483 start_codon:yes stop_codon:yes gene_type:complete
MVFKHNIKQRHKTIQGLRSFKDTLPTNIKKIIKKKGYIYSETLDNWRKIVGSELFKICYPKSFKNSNKFGTSTLLIMVKRGHEIEVEYSKLKIIENINKFFGKKIIEKLKLTTFDDFNEKFVANKNNKVLKSKFINKISNIKNENLKKSLIEFTKFYKSK